MTLDFSAHRFHPVVHLPDGYDVNDFTVPSEARPPRTSPYDVGRYDGVHRDLVFVVAAANYLCSRAGWTSLGVHNVSIPPDDTYRVLGLDEVALSIIWEELAPTLEKASLLADA